MGYLGTDPSLFSAPPLVQQKLEYEKVEEELQLLNKMIRSSYGNGNNIYDTLSFQI